MRGSQSLFRRAAVTGLALAACLTWPALAGAASLPLYRVQAQGLSQTKVRSLAQQFGIRTGLRQSMGTLNFINPSRFLTAPARVLEPNAGVDEDGNQLTRQGFDLSALQALKVLGTSEARQLAMRRFDAAGIGGIGAPVARQTRLGLFGPGGQTVANKVLDTQIIFQRTLNGLPVVGPGERTGLSFDGDGKVTFLNFASRALQRSNITRPVISPKIANATAVTAFTGGCPTLGLRLSRRLVYYSPPPSSRGVTQLSPHYEYSAKTVVGGESVDLLQQFIPAAQGIGPKPKLTLSANGNVVNGRVTVAGGRAPYSYLYSSCSGALSGPGRATFSYQVQSREQLTSDKVTVRVTDANGLVGYATATVQLGAPAAQIASRPQAQASVGGVRDFGVSYIGAEQNVPGAEQHALQWSAWMSQVATKRYSWGHGNFWASDYIDPAFGGNDSAYADNVDFAFVTAHGWPNGFVSGQSDGQGGLRNVTYDKARWGNGDLEWMALLSCQTLKFTDANGKTLGQRWYTSWNRLHMQLGFSTNASNTAGFGNAFGFYLRGLKMPVRLAWAMAAHTHQPAGRVYGFAGPLGPPPNYETNYYDYAFGQGGPSSPDIAPSGYYWALYGQV